MIHILIGTRAQLIKMCPIMKELGLRGLPYNFVFLAQHTTTISEIIDQFGVKRPDYIVCPRTKDITNTLAMIGWSCRVLAHGLFNLERIFKGDRNGVVLIHGDAPPLLLGGILAKARGLKVAQVEAGLRSFNFFKPFPEELTRVVASKIGLIDFYFCQDERAAANVRAAYRYKKIIPTGCNTIIDAIHIAQEQATHLPPDDGEPFAIVTIHRFETISKPDALKQLVELLISISAKIKLHFILHPPTLEALKKQQLFARLAATESIELIPRLSFFDFSRELARCRFIISDGGSNQEECHYLGIPCLLMRNETERTEGLGENAVLARFDRNTIDEFIENHQRYRRQPIQPATPPSNLIVDAIAHYASFPLRRAGLGKTTFSQHST